ncbi:unnamed protein product, partial [Notodromas monacha]
MLFMTDYRLVIAMVTGPDDWKIDENKPPRIPWSCCKKDDTAGPECITVSKLTSVHRTGCLSKITDLFYDNLGTIGGFALALLFIEILGVASG